MFSHRTHIILNHNREGVYRKSSQTARLWELAEDPYYQIVLIADLQRLPHLGVSQLEEGKAVQHKKAGDTLLAERSPAS